jgi:hypothetical protein
MDDFRGQQLELGPGDLLTAGESGVCFHSKSRRLLVFLANDRTSRFCILSAVYVTVPELPPSTTFPRSYPKQTHCDLNFSVERRKHIMY